MTGPGIFDLASMTPQCSADTPSGQCKRIGTGYYRLGCVHEHIRSGWLCDRHAGAVSEARCIACDNEGHPCPLALEAAGASGSA
jgi:hypothetical protein